ncbi:terminase small subunit [Levilactobacillus hammesii]|uniref:Terminase small subunit n=1 Tax=Levilactobacillus hammesii DSM 16381 TaxID=1423753 RepID=A0A0R1UQV6_9LACO|nr:terminase small subunit [Levilactobacillus hammesii]KRL95559.1 Terminase small subunit [Levilactobacillus hammesii DSM 16381]
MQKLTVKQQKFADEYIISGNATQAALNAGYSKKTSYSIGNENLKKPEIILYIERRTKEISESKIADQQEILEYLTATMRGEETESVATAKGIYTDVEVGAKDRVKAAELLGKRLAMWTEKRDVTATIGPVQITDDIPAGSDEDG